MAAIGRLPRTYPYRGFVDAEASRPSHLRPPGTQFVSGSQEIVGPLLPDRGGTVEGEPPWLEAMRAKKERQDYLENLKEETNVAQQQAKLLKAKRDIVEMDGPKSKILQDLASRFMESEPIPALSPEQQQQVRVDELVNELRQKAISPTPEQALGWTQESPEYQDYIVGGGDMDQLNKMRLDAALARITAERGGGVPVAPGVTQLWEGPVPGRFDTGYSRRRREALERSRLRTAAFKEDQRARLQAVLDEARRRMPVTQREFLEHQLALARAKGQGQFAPSPVQKMIAEGLLTPEQGRQLASVKLTGDANQDLKMWLDVLDMSAGRYAGFGKEWKPAMPELYDRAKQEVTSRIGRQDSTPDARLDPYWSALNDQDRQDIIQALQNDPNNITEILRRLQGG